MMFPKPPDQLTIYTYKDLMESFFEKNYPKIEKEKFWRWFNNNLIGKAKDISELDSQEQAQLIDKLQELGDSLFASQHFFEALSFNTL